MLSTVIAAGSSTSNLDNLDSLSGAAGQGVPLLVELLEDVLVKLSDDLLAPSSPQPALSFASTVHPSSSSSATAHPISSSASPSSPTPATSAHRIPPPATAASDTGTPPDEPVRGHPPGRGDASPAEESGPPDYAQREGHALRDAAVRGVMVAVVQALERVLLDGGPRRVFVAADGPALLADVQLLRDFFIARDAEGVAQGLEQAEVVHTTERLQALVVLMHSPTAVLTQRFLNPTAPLPDSDEHSPLTRANLARILLHRAAADAPARSFVTAHRGWLQRVLSRNGAREDSVRERCFGGSRAHPLASPREEAHEATAGDESDDPFERPDFGGEAASEADDPFDDPFEGVDTGRHQGGSQIITQSF